MNRIIRIRDQMRIVGFVCAAASSLGSTLTPLAISANRRHLQDANGTPFFLVGDSPQNLPLKLAVSEFDGYMAECAQRGFNTLWICIDGQRRAATTTEPPQDRQGSLMMRDGWDIGTLNPAYFDTIDAMLSSAEKHGHYCLLTPLSECQWTQDHINANTPEKWRDYGRFLGRRYKSRPNILWHIGNDKINERAQHAVVAGIKDAGDTHLMSVNWRPGYHQHGSAWVRKYERGETWIDLNSWYCNAPIVKGASPAWLQKLEYERPNPMPSFQCEAGYQQPYLGQRDSANATDLYIRMQNYYVALGGGCGGHVYGAGWLADGWDYDNYRDNGGRIQTKHFRNLFARREWWTLVPDYAHTFVTGGYGTLSPTTTDHVGAAIDERGTLGIAYCPTATTITVALAKFSGPVTARWFDPTNGAFTPINGSPFVNSGEREFKTPGLNIGGCEDWVLVLEAAR